jgi:hypothetical protein
MNDEDYVVRKLPGVEPLVKTGPLQFGDEWPGVFIRGGIAIWLSIELTGVLAYIPEDHLSEKLAMGQLLGLLRSCDAGDHEQERTS